MLCCRIIPSSWLLTKVLSWTHYGLMRLPSTWTIPSHWNKGIRAAMIFRSFPYSFKIWVAKWHFYISKARGRFKRHSKARWVLTTRVLVHGWHSWIFFIQWSFWLTITMQRFVPTGWWPQRQRFPDTTNKQQLSNTTVPSYLRSYPCRFWLWVFK